MIAERGEQRQFLGLRFDPQDESEACEWVCRRAGSPSFAYVVTPNVDHVVQIHSGGDPEIQAAYREADLTLCDSRILAKLASASALDLPVVPGSDLTRDLLQKGLPGGRIAVVGGDELLHREIARILPMFDWHFHCPPMGVRHDPLARAAIARFVEEIRADVVLFAIGAPQSELTCAQIKRGGRARGVALCIGASLEFLTGAKRRAPRWMQRAGLEWLFRLASEPARLWRRYLVEGPRILSIWWSWRSLKERRSPVGSDSSPSGGL